MNLLNSIPIEEKQNQICREKKTEKIPSDITSQSEQSVVDPKYCKKCKSQRGRKEVPIPSRLISHKRIHSPRNYRRTPLFLLTATSNRAQDLTQPKAIQDFTNPQTTEQVTNKTAQTKPV